MTALQEGATPPDLLLRMPSGFAVLNMRQPAALRGSCMLLPAPVVASPNALSAEERAQFFTDLVLLGDAILEVTGAERINYLVLCNQAPELHGHCIPRFADEEPSKRLLGPFEAYDFSDAPVLQADGADAHLAQSLRSVLQRLLGGLVLMTLLVACSTSTSVTAGFDEYAYIKHGAGIYRIEADGTSLVPGTKSVDTYCWAADGEGFLVTQAGVLSHIDLHGARTRLLSDYAALRFPDVRSSDGAIVVAATQGSHQGPWRVLMLATDGSTTDLGPGYDPCFTRDGAAVVFEDYEASGAVIYQLDLASGRRRALASGHTPSVAPHGASVYFSEQGQLMRVPIVASGTSPEAITPAGKYDRFVSSSRGGNRLLFFRQDGPNDEIVELELASGTERVVLRGRAELPSYRP